MSKDDEGLKGLFSKMLGGERSDAEAIRASMQEATCEVRMTASLIYRLVKSASCNCPDCIVIVRICREFANGEAFNKLTTEAKKCFLSGLIQAERDIAMAAELEKLEQQFAPKPDEPPTAYTAKPSDN